MSSTSRSATIVLRVGDGVARIGLRHAPEIRLRAFDVELRLAHRDVGEAQLARVVVSTIS
jgi:hypothetical protein